MLSGVYRVSFQGPLESSKGIIYAKNGRIVGGDSWYVYGGTFDMTADRVSATIRIINDDPTHSGIFGRLSNFVMTISGRESRRGFLLEGFPEGQPQQRFAVDGIKLGDA